MTLAGSLSILETSGLIQPAGTDPEIAYQFRHALIQDAAYESLLRQERRRLHLAVGETLERLHTDRRAEIAGELALHFEKAEEDQRAFTYLVLAGKHALSRFAVREARAFLERAERYLPKESSDPEVLRRQVETRLLLVEAGFLFIPFDQDLALIEAVLPVAERLADQRLLAQVQYWIARIRYGRGDPSTSPEFQQSLHQAIQIGQKLNEDSVRALPIAIIGQHAVQVSDYPRGISALEEAIPLLVKHGHLAEAAVNAGVLAIAYGVTGEFARAEEFGRRALDWAEQSGDPNAKVDAELFVGRVHSERGRHDEGLALMRNGVAVAEQIGNLHCAAVGNFYLAGHYLRSGRPDLALPSLERGIELGQYCNIGPSVKLGHALRRVARLEPGNAAEATAAWESAFTAAREMRDSLTIGQLYHQRANMLAMAPLGWEMARSDYEASEKTFEEIGARPYLANVLRDYGLALRARGQNQLADQKLQKAAEIFETLALRNEATAIREAIGKT